MGDLPDRSTATTVEYGGVAYTPVNQHTWVSSSGTYGVYTPSSGKRLVITDILVSTDTAMTVIIKDSSANEYIRVYLADNGGFVMNLTTPIRLPVNAVLQMETTADGNVSITICGYEE